MLTTSTMTWCSHSPATYSCYHMNYPNFWLCVNDYESWQWTLEEAESRARLPWKLLFNSTTGNPRLFPRQCGRIEGPSEWCCLLLPSRPMSRIKMALVRAMVNFHRGRVMGFGMPHAAS